MTQQTTKISLKTKIIAIISIAVIFIGVVLAVLSINKTSYLMPIDKPARIIVYNNSETNNIVFEASDEEYNQIYNLIVKGHQKRLINALFTKDLNKDVKIEQVENTQIKFSGIKVNFEYDHPIMVKHSKEAYYYNEQAYWYQNLIFDININDKFAYHSIAIIPPQSSNYYLGAYKYCVQYLSYSNLHQVHNYSINLFE